MDNNDTPKSPLPSIKNIAAGIVSSSKPQWVKPRRCVTVAVPFGAALLLAFLLVSPFKKSDAQKETVTRTEQTRSGVKVKQLPRLNPGGKPEPLYLDFNQSVAPLEMVNKEIAEGISITPGKTGKWSWSSDKQVLFVPDEDWELGTKYKVTFAKELFPEHITLRNFEVSFSTEAFKATLSNAQFYIDPVDPTVKKATAEVRFNYPVDKSSFTELVSLRGTTKENANEPDFANKSFNVKVTYDANDTIAYLVSESLPLPYNDAQLTFEVTKGARSLYGGKAYNKAHNAKVIIPGASTYVRINRLSFEVVRDENYILKQIIALETKGESEPEETLKSIEAWILPKDQIADPGNKPIEDYHWPDIKEITDRVIAKSKKVSLTPLPIIGERSSFLTYEVKIEPGSYLFLRINKGATFYGGYCLARSYTDIVRVPSYPREIKIIGDGAILSMKGGMNISLFGQGINRVNYTLARVRQNQLNHLISQSNGILDNLNFNNNYQFGAANISEYFSDSQTFSPIDPADTRFFSFDLSRFLHNEGENRNGIFFFTARGDNSGSDSRFVVVTDIGILVKKNADGSHTLFTQSISSGEPLSGVEVEVLGLNGLPLTNAELQIKIDKNSYEPGEEIEVYIKAPYTGSGLITIERDKVYAHKWFTSNSVTTLQSITVPEGLEGNGYINVSFVRSAESNRIYMSPLSHGTVPFTISRERRIQPVTITAPEVMKPGEKVTITYTTTEPSRIVLYGVDRGILQVADYQTPDPINHFFRKRALEVTTYQILDLILPEYKVIGRNSPAGGGGGPEAMLSRNLNPFKRKRKAPVVFWSGLMEKSAGKHTYTYTVPDYFNGTIDLFAVAVSSDKIGVAQDEFTVRDDFVLSPTVPAFAAPGDEIVVTTSVANNLRNNDDKLTITLEKSEGLTVIGEDSHDITIPPGREDVVSFTLKVGDKLGAEELLFRVTGGGLTSTLQEALSIRPITPYRTLVRSGVVKGTQKKVEASGEVLYPELRSLEGSLSFLPIALTSGLNKYLSNYPYGCTEQLTSRAFPYVAFFDQSEIAFDRDKWAMDFERFVTIIAGRQQSNGGFGYWSSYSYINNHYSIYALHMFIEAKEKGLSVPEYVINRGEDFLWKIIRQKKESYVTRAYAIYLLTRLGNITTNSINDLWEEMKAEKAAFWEESRAVPFMVATYDIMQLEEEANKLERGIRWESLLNKGDLTYYLYNTQYLYLLAKHKPERIKNADLIIDRIVDGLQKRRYTTTSSAFTVMALTELISSRSDLFSKRAEVKEILKDGSFSPALPLSGNLQFSFEYSGQAQDLQLLNPKENRLYYQTSETGFALLPPEEKVVNGIDVYVELQRNKTKINTIKVGEEATLRVALRSEGGSVNNVAIVCLLPGGLEVDPAYSPTFKRGGIEYIDLCEDRMVIYATVTKNVTYVTIPVQGVNAGEFVIPPLYAEAMYNPDIMGISTPGKLTIKAP